MTTRKLERNFKHLIKRTVLEENGPGATASIDEVFGDYGQSSKDAKKEQAETKRDGASDESKAQSKGTNGDAKKQEPSSNSSFKPFALFSYKLKRNDLTLKQLMKEAREIHTKKFPGSGTALLRSIIEILLKIIIEEKNLNSQGKQHDIESAANVVIGQGKMSADDVAILKEFKNSHIKYINLSSHATVVPNYDRLMMARDCVDAFVKRNV